MSDEGRDNKAQKLASARKKLKEYQQRHQNATATNSTMNPVPITNSGMTTGILVESTSTSGSGGPTSSNISEHSESGVTITGSSNNNNNNNDNRNINGLHNCEQLQQKLEEMEKDNVRQLETTSNGSAPESLNNIAESERRVEMSSNGQNETTGANSSGNVSAMQILINEKIQLTNELNRLRGECQTKALALEELRVSHARTLERMEELQYAQSDQQERLDRQYDNVEELQKELSVLSGQQNDNVAHLKELSGQLMLKDGEITQLTHELHEKNKKLELSELRIKQLSLDTNSEQFQSLKKSNSDQDAINLDRDGQIASLTQIKFMYEQQIRDLQAMLEQSNSEKEQSNAQYLTYVQQLNKQVKQLSERNAQLQMDNQKLQEREQQLLKHTQSMEKDIQKNLSKQQEFNEKTLVETQRQELETLREQISDLELERHEFQLKIKSQEMRLEEVMEQLEVKQRDYVQLRGQMERFLQEKPDNVKLLAIMESDKVAASRALTQNTELKKQLDELEQRFVQLTNDKAELMNTLDAERYANREIHSNCSTLEERIQTMEERFKYKDNEMIRLSHENEELSQVNAALRQELKELQEGGMKNGGGGEGMKEDLKTLNEEGESNNSNNCPPLVIESPSLETESNQQNDEQDDDQQQKHEAIPENLLSHSTPSEPPKIATSEAVEKLQDRFNQLMGQVADLTDEKQRLEHLVMQLQGETETIGEYIALYQNQRRMLKQREYEREAQTQMLQDERRQMQERLLLLNNLVKSLGLQPQPQQQQQHIPVEGMPSGKGCQVVATPVSDVEQERESCVGVTTEPYILDATAAPDSCVEMSTENGLVPPPHHHLEEGGRQEILQKIHQIINDIGENSGSKLSGTGVPPSSSSPSSYNAADHLQCCSGKFEIV